MRHLSSVPFFPPFLNSRTFTLLPSPLLPFPTCSYFDIAVVSLASIYNQVCDTDSLLSSGSLARPGKQRNEVGEMRTGSQHGVSVSADLLLPVYWIDADQSTATSRPRRPRWPEEETPLQFLEHRSFVFEPFDIWRFRTRLVSRFTTEVGWFTPPSSIFWSDFFFISSIFVDTGDNRNGLSAACNKFEVSRTYMLEISAVLRKFLCFRRRKTCLEFDTAAEYFMSFERCL